MDRRDWLTTAEISELFTEEITAIGGDVSDTFDDGARLFTRAILPQFREVKRRDQVQAGVALRASEEEIWVHPYLFRLVCRNGTIRAHALQSRHLTVLHAPDPVLAGFALREAVRACSAGEAFTAGVREMRSAAVSPLDAMLSWAHVLSKQASQAHIQAGRRAMSRFMRGADRSPFGLMNAITSVARDTPDPALRWDLEALGGGVPVALEPTGPARPLGGRAVRRDQRAQPAAEEMLG